MKFLMEKPMPELSSSTKRRQEDGRPKKHENGTKRICISLPVELVDAFKALGGSNWVREEVIKAIATKGQ